MNKSTAVIIMNWNGEKLLRQFLPSVCRNTNHDIADVVVADNGSTDNSLQLLAEEFKQVKVLSFSENYGYAGGYNEAISRLREYKYAVLLNSDVEVTEGWIEPVVEYMQQHEDVMACQPKILSYTDRHRFEYAGAAGGCPCAGAAAAGTGRGRRERLWGRIISAGPIRNSSPTPTPGWRSCAACWPRGKSGPWPDTLHSGTADPRERMNACLWKYPPPSAGSVLRERDRSAGRGRDRPCFREIP